MAYVGDAAGGFRRRLLGYDRRQVERVIAAAHAELMRVRHERDELRETAGSVERIGGEVAELLRAMAARVADVEANAYTRAGEVLAAAEAEAERVRAEARALLEDARRQVEERTVDVTRWRDDALAGLREAGERIGSMIDRIAELRPEELVQDTPAAATDGAPPAAVINATRAEDAGPAEPREAATPPGEPERSETSEQSGVERELASVLRWIHERTEPANGS